MKRAVLGSAAFGLLGVFATVTGFAATLGVESGTIDTFSDAAAATTTTTTTPPAGDTRAPALVSLEMFDVDVDGRVDQVKATFDEALASDTAGTAPWTLANVPSDGALASVSVNGAVATLAITEGGGAEDTAVGSFTVALAQHAAGVRDAAGNRSSFAATGPLDRARPMAMSLAMANGGTAGRPDKDDSQVINFSEPLDPSSICAGQASDFVLATNADGLVATLTDGTPEVLSFGSTSACSASLRVGTIALGAADYLTAGTRTFSGTGSNRTEVSWTAASRALHLVLGGESGAAAAASSVQRTATYLPDSGLRDRAGNAITSKTVSYTGVPF